MTIRIVTINLLKIWYISVLKYLMFALKQALPYLPFLCNPAHSALRKTFNPATGNQLVERNPVARLPHFFHSFSKITKT
jgi:hypothetical protein